MDARTLRAQHRDLLAQARQIVGPPDAPRALSEEEAAKVRSLLEEAARIRQQLETLSDLRAQVEASERALPPESRFIAPETRTPAPPAKRSPEDRVRMLGRFIRAVAAGRGDLGRAVEWTRVHWGDEEVMKALQASVGTAGGFLVPDELSADVIELLRPASAVRRLNPLVIATDSGSFRIPGFAGGAAASYITEGANITVTEPSFRQVVLSYKKLAAIVPISNDLLRFASPSIDTLVRDDLVAAIAEESDKAFIRGSGSEGKPRGLRFWAPSANVIAANATINLANVTADLSKLVLKLKEATVRMRRPGWIFAPRTEQYLLTVRDANGNFAFRQEMEQGRLWGWPFVSTTNVPVNLGAGSDESEVYLADFADVVIGESTRVLIDTSSEAAYVSGSNTLSAFSRDETLVRAITEHDLAVRYDKSVAVLTAVKWTP